MKYKIINLQPTLSPMKKVKIVLIFTLTAISSLLYSQETNQITQSLKKNAISFNLLGTTPFLGATYERIVSKKFVYEVGLGIPSIGAGIKIFPKGIVEDKLKFHFGLSTVYFYSGDNDFIGAQGSIIYFPIGWTNYLKSGKFFGFDLGPAILMQKTICLGGPYVPGTLPDGTPISIPTSEYNCIEPSLAPYFNIKIGKRF